MADCRAVVESRSIGVSHCTGTPHQYKRVFGWRKLYREGLVGIAGQQRSDLVAITVTRVDESRLTPLTPLAAVPSRSGCLRIETTKWPELQRAPLDIGGSSVPRTWLNHAGFRPLLYFTINPPTKTKDTVFAMSNKQQRKPCDLANAHFAPTCSALHVRTIFGTLLS